MRRSHGHFRRGASSRRCNVVDDRMNRAFGEAAVVAEAEVDDRMKRALSVAAVAAEAEVDDPMKRPLREVATCTEALAVMSAEQAPL